MATLKVFGRVINSGKVVPALQKILEGAEPMDGRFLFFGRKYQEKSGHSETHDQYSEKRWSYAGSSTYGRDGHSETQRDSGYWDKYQETRGGHSDYSESPHHTEMGNVNHTERPRSKGPYHTDTNR